MVNECKSVILMFVWRLHAILKSGSMMDLGYKAISSIPLVRIQSTECPMTLVKSHGADESPNGSTSKQ